MTEVLERNRFPVRLLIAELIIAPLLGAWGGGQQLPYDSLIAVFGLLICLGIAVTALINAVRSIRKGSVPNFSLWAPVLLVIAVQPVVWLTLVSTFRVFDERGTEARFERNRAQFDCIVSHVAKRTWQNGHHFVQACGTGANVYVTDQVRVEVDLAGAFTNWEVIVHDPSETLRLIESPWVNLGPPNLRNTLGDFSIRYCRRLSGKYFFCGIG